MPYLCAMRKNPAAVTLFVGSGVSLLLGAILWIVGANQLRGDSLNSDYFKALNLDNGTAFADPNSGAIAADTALIWWGVGLVIFGALLLIAALVTRALLTQMQHQEEPAAKTYQDYLAER